MVCYCVLEILNERENKKLQILLKVEFHRAGMFLKDWGGERWFPYLLPKIKKKKINTAKNEATVAFFFSHSFIQQTYYPSSNRDYVPPPRMMINFTLSRMIIILNPTQQLIIKSCLFLPILE